MSVSCCGGFAPFPYILRPVIISPSFSSGVGIITDLNTPVTVVLQNNVRNLSISNTSVVDAIRISFGTSDGQSHQLIVPPGGTGSINLNLSMPVITAIVLVAAVTYNSTITFYWNAST